MPQLLYDEARLGELRTHEAECLSGIEEHRTRMRDMLESDQGWPEERHAEYQRLQMQESELDRDLRRTREEISRIELVAPRDSAEPVPFERFLRGGMAALSESEVREQRDLAERAGEWDRSGIAAGGSSFLVSRRTPGGPSMAVASDADSGSALVDTETQPRLVEGLRQFGGAREVAYAMTTSRGNPINIPRVDASAQEGVRLGGQGSTIAELATPDLGHVQIGAYTYTSRAVRVTVEMVQDTEFDIMGWVERQVIRRLGRITNREFTLGTGSGQPQGSVPAALTSTTAASATSITWEELLDLTYDVDEAYLSGGERPMGGSPAEMGGMTCYMFNRSTEGVLRKLKDGEGRPLWQPSLVSGAPDMIHGWPYVLNFHMAGIAASAKPILFGNFAYHVIRSSANVMVHSFFDSRTAIQLEHEVHAFCRDDARIIGPLNGDDETPAFAALTMAAS